MHLLFENVVKNLVYMWMGKFKGLDAGREDYIIPQAIWKEIGQETVDAVCYISFSLSSFYWLSRCSDSAPDITSLHTNYSSTCYTFCIYPYFRFQVFFLMFPTFTCAPIYPSTCFHLSFHVLWLCWQPFPSYYDTLYFYVLSSLWSWLIPTQYINQCIFLVVLQFINGHWFSSSPIFSLSLLYLLKALFFLSSLSSSSGNYIFTKTKLQPSNLTSWPLTKF